MDELARCLEAVADALGLLVWAGIAAMSVVLLVSFPPLLLPFALLVAWWWSKRPR